MAKKLTKAKAREILHDKEVHGYPLTDKQRRFFGAISGGAKPYKAENGIEGTMGGLTDKGFNFNPAWGGAWKNGGWLEKYADGGNVQPPMAGANQTVPMAQTGTRQPIYTSDPQDPRLRAYQDSLSLHNLGKKYFGNTYGYLNGSWSDDQSDYEKRKNLKYHITPESTFQLPWWKDEKEQIDMARMYNAMANKSLSTDILPIGGYYGEGYYPAFKKPVQPVEYKKRVLEKPNLSVELPKNIKTKERPQPKTDRKGAAPAPKTISDTPTKYSYTYPSGNQQKTIYFPSKSTWKAFVDQFDGLNTTEQAGSFSATPGAYTRERRPNPVFSNIKFAMGGSLPGSVGFTYARVAGAAPSEGPRAKKTMPSAQNGMEMKFYQEGLDFKPKTISKNGGWLNKFDDGGEIVQDDEGYWNPQNWGKPVEINSNEITMEGVLEPLLGISDTGDRQMMYPGKNYTFEGTKVVEYPREYFTARDGKSVNRADEYPLEKLDNLFNFTNYNKPTAKNGKWLDKYK